MNSRNAETAISAGHLPLANPLCPKTKVKAHEMLAKVRSLPSISTAGIELLNRLHQSEVGNVDIVDLLKRDSVLTAKLLRACNSPALALAEPVASVDQAVLMLGHGQIADMITGLVFRSALATPLPAYTLSSDQLWRHSLLSAHAAEVIVANSPLFEVESSVAFTVGLLHDIGKLITNEFLTRDSLSALRERVAAGRSTVEAERDVLGTDHAEVGAGLLYMWRLPEGLVEAVALHHHPALSPKPRLSALAAVADRVAHYCLEVRDEGRSLAIRPADAELFDALSVTKPELEAFVGCIAESTDRANELMLTA